jgi:hypothetical protein
LAFRTTVTSSAPATLQIDLDDGLDHRFRIEVSTASETHVDLPLLGMRPDRSYDLTVTATTPAGDTDTWELTVTTPALPPGWPALTVHTWDVDAAAPGYLSVDARRFDGSGGYSFILDDAGEVVWYLPAPRGTVIERLANGRLLVLYVDEHLIAEIDMLGSRLLSWHSALSTDGDGESLPVQSGRFHHEAIKLESTGTYLTSGRESDRTVPDYPLSETDPDQTGEVLVVDEPIIEFDGDGEVVGTWSFLDLLKPTRVGFDAVPSSIEAPADWVHTNGLAWSPDDDSILASLRHQDGVVKVSRSTGELIWILGPPANWEGFEQYLLTPVGDDFAWSYHQHAPMVTPDGTVLLFDNGNNRASPFTGEPRLDAVDNYSRAVEYAIDEEAMTVTQVWQYGEGLGADTMYSAFVGDADRLDNGNTLVTFGALCSIDGVPNDSHDCHLSARIREVTAGDSPTVVLDLEMALDSPDPESRGILAYRADRLDRLYGRDDITIVPLP